MGDKNSFERIDPGERFQEARQQVTSSRRNGRWRHNLAYAVGVAASACIIVLLFSRLESLRMPGPLMHGHSELECESCHWPAPGTTRQQLQSIARSAVRLEASSVDLGARRVGTEACVSCHERMDDRHPVFRFAEPRFAKMREALGPLDCTTCHPDHSGRRISAQATVCRHCHGELKMKHDPLDVSHHELVVAKRWKTCLTCHDFHGNHDHQPPLTQAAALPQEIVDRYLHGGDSPYGPPIVKAVAQRVKP